MPKFGEFGTEYRITEIPHHTSFSYCVIILFCYEYRTVMIYPRVSRVSSVQICHVINYKIHMYTLQTI